MVKRILRVLAATVAVAGVMVGMAPSATAAARDGNCQSGEFCLYYNDSSTGSLVDMINSQRDYGTGSSCIKFENGSQAGTCVKNRAGSFWNRTGKSVYVFYNSDFGGTYDKIPAGAKAKLNANTHKNNASHIIGNAELRFPLVVTQSQIKNHTPMWCWNSKSTCHHDYNAADIFASTGTKVVSPVSGTIKSVGSNPARVTIKDSFGRLWYMTHMLDGSLQVNDEQSVSKGTAIGQVGNSADAAGTSPHLHIDMRVGVNERASCSGAACAGLGFVNIQPLLRTAFLARP